MRPFAGFLVTGILLILSPLAAAEEPATVRARALRDFVLDGELAEWAAARIPTLTFGEKNLIKRESPPLSQEWSEDDLSGELYVAYSGTSLLIAGRIRDDELTLNPTVWWSGDEVEVFIDVAPDDPDEDPTVYTDDDFQLVLFPLAEGRTWGLAVAAGRRGQRDGGFDGVETAGKIIEEEGKYLGYTFETKIPFVNFPGLRVREGTTIGFDLALSDADGEFVQKTYMTLSGRENLSAHPERFGRLTFDESLPPVGATKPPTGAGWWQPWAILLGALLLAALLWRFRRPLIRLADVRLHAKLAGILVLLLLLAAARFIPGVFRSARETGAREQLASKTSALLEILEEAAGEHLLGSARTPPDPAEVLNLLRGEEATAPERYDQRMLWVRKPGMVLMEESGTPYIDYDRSLSLGGEARFEATGPVSCRTISVIHSLRPDPTSRRDIEQGRGIARVRAVLAKGEPVDWDLVCGEDVQRGAEREELILNLQMATGVVRVEVLQTLDEGSFVIHGVTLLAEDAPVPLPLVTRTLVGVDTNLWRNRPAGTGATIEPGGEPAVIPLIPPVDRVWVLYALQPNTAGTGRSRMGSEVVELTFVGEDGARSEPFLLRRGIHLDPELLRASLHPPEFEAEEAYRWTPKGGHSRHRDVVAIPVPEGGAVALEARNVGKYESVLLAGVTQGRLLTHDPDPDGLTSLLYDPEKRTYRLRPGPLRSVLGLGFTVFRDSRAVRSTLEEQDLAGTALPSDIRSDLLRGTSSGSIGERRLGEGTFLTWHVGLNPGGRDALQVSLPLPGVEDVEAVTDVAGYAFLALLLLAVLLVLADLLARLSRLRSKLTLGFAIATLVPLLLFFLGLSGVLEREMSRTESDTLLDQLRLVRDSFQEMREDVRRKARGLLRDPRLLDAIAVESPEGYYDQTDAVVGEISATASPFRGPAKVFVEDTFGVAADARPRVFPLGTRDHPFLETWKLTDDLNYQWARLSLEGVAASEVGDGARRIAVEVPVGPELLEEIRSRFGRRFDLLLFTLRGYPLAGTLVLDDEFAPGQVEARRGLLEALELSRSPVVRTEPLAGAPCAVAYDVLTSSRDEPVALVAVALPHREIVAAKAEVRNLFLLLGAVILILEIIVGNILTRRITEPLTALSRGARSVARGNLTTRVGVTTGDEIGRLAGSFNRMTAELSRRIQDLSKLNAASRTFSGSLDRDRVLERAVEAFRDAAPAAARVAVVVAEETEFILAAGSESVGIARDEGILSRCVSLSSPEIISPAPAPASGEVAALGRPKAVVGIPFGPGSNVEGAAVFAYGEEDPAVGPGDLEFLSTMAQQVAIALENAHLYHLAIEDPATGTYVHSHFLSRLREETDRALAGDRPLSVVLVSLPDLERLYETYGESDGDQVFGDAARRVRAAATGMHILARADRVTIEVLLPESDKERAFESAQQIREALTRSSFPLEDAPGGTVSIAPAIGLASCPEDARSAEFLLGEARRALYKAVTDLDGSPIADTARERARVHDSIARTGVSFVFRSEKILELVETVDRIATSEVPILIQGETGVGKEVLAELVHEKSERRRNPLLKVNCAAIPETLLEAELFGHEKGAFTGADRRKPGRFELAQGGTIFLDEVGEIPPHVQVKLLRVLEDHMVERLGSTSPLHVDVRVIAATNRDLPAAIREARFREDLYFRLNVVSLVIPPLRARKEDIPALTDHFIETYRKSQETTGRRLSPAALDKLFTHSWPGNVRELKNVVQRALVIARREEIRPDEIVFAEPSGIAAAPTAERPHAPPVVPAGNTEGLNARQIRLLAILAECDSITNRAYSEVEGISPRTGNRDLLDLIERGLIQQVGRRRGAVYRITS